MLTRISPEGFEIANAYLECGTVQDTAKALRIPEHEVVKTLSQREIKTYLDGVYMDLGYRNRNKLGALLDKMIDQKIEEAEESGVYTSKDLFELIQFAHKMRMDEIKAEQKVDQSQHIQIAQFGEGAYGKLMERLINGKRQDNQGDS
jgi:tRNA(Ile)-lysidine synthase TilS/MesJ